MVSIKNLPLLNDCTILWKWTVGGALCLSYRSVCLFVCLFFFPFFKAIVDSCAYNICAIIYHSGKYSFRQLPYYVMLKKINK